MKKNLIIALILAVVIGAGAGIFLMRGKAAAIEDVLPEGALFYVKFSDVRDNLAAVESTAFWQSLRSVPWAYLFEKNRLTPPQQDLLKSIGEKLAEPSTAAIFNEFFGKEFAVAFYPSGTVPAVPAGTAGTGVLPEKDMYAFAREMFSNILLVTRVQGKGIFIEFLSGLLGQYNTQIQAETVDVDGHTLHYVSLPGADVRLGFVNVHDFLIIGMDGRILEQSIKTSRGDVAALASDAHFRKSRERALEPAEVNGYWNVAEISSSVNEYLGALITRTEEEMRDTSAPPPEEEETTRQNVERVKTWLRERSRLAAGLDVLGFSGRWEDMFSLKFDLYFDKAQVDSRRVFAFSCPPGPNATWAFAPADVLAYQWSNCLDLDASWDEIKQEIAVRAGGGDRSRSPDAGSPIDMIEGILDVNIAEDVLPAFGDEMGGYLRDIRMGTSFPVPDGLFFIKIKDEGKARQLLVKLEDRFREHLRREDYNGISIGYIADAAAGGGDLEPAYCILDKYFLLALTRSALKEALDRYQNHSTSLAASEDFQSVHLSAGDQSRSLQFVRVGAAARKLEDVLAWAKTRLAAKYAQKEAFQSGIAKRLADIARDMQPQEQESAEMKKEMMALEDEIGSLESQQVDAAMQRAQLEQLKEKAQGFEEELADARARQKDLEETRRGYERSLADKKRRDEIGENVVVPFLKSLTFLKTWGIRTTLENGAFESSLFLKVE